LYWILAFSIRSEMYFEVVGSFRTNDAKKSASVWKATLSARKVTFIKHFFLLKCYCRPFINITWKPLHIGAVLSTGILRTLLCSYWHTL
jgi:hypothetical protein